MRKKILNILKSSPEKAFTQKEILARLKPRHHDLVAAKTLIRKMINSGDIAKAKGERIRLPRTPKQVEGKLTVTQKGFGFVITQDDHDDIFIGRRSMGDAIHGDIVSVKIKNSPSPQGFKGRIDKVIQRASNSFVGVTYFFNGKLFLEISPINPARRIRLIKVKKDLGEGKIVKAVVKDWGSAYDPIIAVFDSVLGNANDPRNDLKLILHKYDYDQSFSPELMKEVKAFSEANIKNEIENRMDLRDVVCFTIDPEDAKDFDDAISIKKIKNGIELGVHIADVSHFVSLNSVIDKEAVQRATSVYFTEGVVHMLPKELSADLCSLRPGIDRLTISALIKLDDEYNVVEADIKPAVINSKERFTYKDVQNIIDGKNEHSYKSEILHLKKIADALFKKRSKNGSIDFDIPEPIFTMGEKGIPKDIRPSERLISHRIVEECMLLANQVVAIEVPKKLPKYFPFVYRVHEKPDTAKVERFGGLLKRLKLGTYVPDGDLSPNDFKNILKHVEGSPYRSLIETVALRTMSKAEYAIKNRGHFGLAFQNYTHFTSPIRRYPDLLVHRMIKMVCNGAVASKTEWKETMANALELSNAKEIEALSAEREYLKIKQLRWLAERINLSFDGQISGVINFGFFVSLDSSMVEGLVHIDTLENDEFTYDEDSYCLKGRHYKKEYRLGDKVKIKIVSVQIDEQRANFSIQGQD